MQHCMCIHVKSFLKFTRQVSVARHFEQASSCFHFVFIFVIIDSVPFGANCCICCVGEQRMGVMAPRQTAMTQTRRERPDRSSETSA